MKKIRLDQFLVNQNLIKSRSQGNMLIKKGEILVDGIIQTKPGFLVNEENKIEIPKEIYVGRGAFKLLEALEEFSISVESLVVADIGASTGGFTQVLLKNGAMKVYAIDVGHDQLAPDLISDHRVINMEGVNVKYPIDIKELVDLAVIDLSFISLKKVILNIKNILKPQGKVVALIKPQFEVGKENLGKGGIVKSEELQRKALKEVHECFIQNGFSYKKSISSPILGKDGNKEFLSYLVLN